MHELDVLLRGGTVVTAAEVLPADIGVADGRIVALAPGLNYSAREIVDAAGLHIFPGVIDAHVHFNDPGRGHWEGIASGSRALAAGGGTLFFDMPLNSSPPTVDGEAFAGKLAVARKTSLTDFALWGGLVPGNLDQLEELAEAGVIGFKAFMSNSGMEDFRRVDDDILREGMKRAARLNRIVAVHAESEAMTAGLASRMAAEGRTGIRDYLDSRPIEAELDAIARALALAADTGCALHIVHVSCGAGITLIASAKKMGIDVSCETCPHYLVLTEDDLLAIGAVAKCAPPLRPAAARETLWRCLEAGCVNTIGSDHSPSPPGMKTDADFFKIWGGISGAQHTLPLLLTHGHVDRNIALPLLGRLLSFDVARRFSLPPSKGGIALGVDADLTVVDLGAQFCVQEADLLYQHRQTPYLGRRLRGRVRRTMLRGRTIIKDSQIAAEPLGQLVRPET